MKHNLLKPIFLALFVAVCLPIMAQEVQPTTTVVASEPTKKELKEHKRAVKREMIKNQPKVSTEFGLGVGARYNFFGMEPLSEGFIPSMKMTWSGGAALQFRLNIGRSFGFQPEISYARSTLRISDATGNNLYDTKVKSNIVQIPMLLSFRAAMFRFNFGPVFTLMDDATYQLARVDDESIQQMHIGRIYPVITYAAGISVKFAKVMMIDLRYANQFTDIKSHNEYVWTLDQSKQAEAWKFRTRTQSVQLRFGVVF
jgi:hypothetical protein